MCLATSFLETHWLIAAVTAISKLLLNSIIHLLGLIFPMAPLEGSAMDGQLLTFFFNYSNQLNLRVFCLIF
jgi:fumarate reductase subunit D